MTQKLIILTPSPLSGSFVALEYNTSLVLRHTSAVVDSYFKLLMSGFSPLDFMYTSKSLTNTSSRFVVFHRVKTLLEHEIQNDMAKSATSTYYSGMRQRK